MRDRTCMVRKKTTMNEIAVIALPIHADAQRSVADAVKGRILPYRDDVFESAMASCRGIIAIMATGIAVRKIAKNLSDKWHDPAVVVVSPDLRYAIPLIGGHHGANELAKLLCTTMGVIPVITTATEAAGLEAVEVIADREGLRIINRESTRMANTAILAGNAGIYRVPDPGMVIAGPGVSFLVDEGIYSVGIGCRRGVSSEEVQSAVMQALADASLHEDEVAIYASTRLKVGETGLIDGVRACKGVLIFLDDRVINATASPTKSAAERLGLAGVAEPAALAVSRKGELIMEKKIYGNITIAIAR